MPKKLVRTYVRPELIEEYERQFPQSGAVSWLLELAITEALALVQGQPDFKSLVGSAVRASILRERHQTQPNDHSLTVEPIP